MKPADIEKRKRKRAPLRLKVMIIAQKGAQEISKTADVSPYGLSVALALDLELGEVVSVFCPYTEGQNLEQKAVVSWREPYSQGHERFYGLKYISR